MLRYRFLRPRYVLYRLKKYLQDSRELREWRRQGSPLPPPHLVKQQTVKRYGKMFGLHTLIETGTYTGAMVFAMQDDFARIYTVELDDKLFNAARKNLAKFAHVEPVHGDSGDVLPQIMARVNEPCLFWLDGHFSGEGTAKGRLHTPIMRELECILEHPITNHAVLIDDAHCFVGEDDYPTIEEIRELANSKRPDWHFEVKDNILRIHPDRRP